MPYIEIYSNISAIGNYLIFNTNISLILISLILLIAMFGVISPTLSDTGKTLTFMTVKSNLNFEKKNTDIFNLDELPELAPIFRLIK
jgi:hypothetical protein